jgi:hypothetical protein
MTLSLSIPSMNYSQKTMLQFRCVVLPERSCGSLTGQGEKASVERPVAAGRLQNTVSLSEEWGKYNKRFILFISLNTS